jgi:hypothetical protein
MNVSVDSLINDREDGFALTVPDEELFRSISLDRVQGNARLAEASVAEEAAAALEATDKDVSIGGAGVAAAAISLASSTSCACSAIRLSSVAAPRFCHRSPSTSHST